MLVNTRFQVLFHSPPGVLFTFPSRYFSTIGHQVVFRLGGWSPRIPIGFHVSDGTLDTDHLLRISLTGLSPSLVGLPIPFGYTMKCLYRSEPRLYYYFRFGLFRFRSPLLSESILFFLFLRVFRCFSSPGSPDITMCSLCRITTLLVMSSLIRTSAVLRLFATPRSFSQLVTSFFGAMYQGILHTLFVAYSSFSILLFFVFRLCLLFLKKILPTVFRINLDQIFFS